MDKAMTFDEALVMMKNSVNAEDQRAKLKVASRMGGMIKATEIAYQVARECIKRCRDFGELRAKIGGKIYWAGYDKNFPDESEVEELEVKDVSAAGLVQISYAGRTIDWVDPKDPKEQLYQTREEAEAALKKMKEAAG